jgi:hypothetical protein
MASIRHHKLVGKRVLWTMSETAPNQAHEHLRCFDPLDPVPHRSVVHQPTVIAGQKPITIGHQQVGLSAYQLVSIVRRRSNRIVYQAPPPCALDPFRSLRHHETFDYALPQGHPSIDRSTLVLARRGRLCAVRKGTSR